MRTVIAYIALQLLVLSSVAHAGVAPTQSWYEFNFHGKKVGFLQMSDKTTHFQGQKAHHAYRRSVVTVRRQSHVIRIEATTDAWSTPSGVPLKFIHRRVENQAERQIVGIKKGDKFVVTHVVGARKTSKTIDLKEGVFLSSTLDFLFKSKLKKDFKHAGKVIVEEDGELRDFALRVLEKTKEGQFIVENKVADIVSKEWISSTGVTLRTKVERLGAEFIRTDREQALKLEETEDIFTAARLVTHAALPIGDRIAQLTVRLSGKSGKKPRVPKDRRQRIRKTTKNSVEIRISTSALPLRPSKLPIKTKRMRVYLAETPYESLKDPRLIAQARKLMGGQRNAWTVAKSINRFVHKHIQNKSLAHAFSTASEALAAREGDCTEHAVLFSALAKIVGIPTKLVTGLVYVGGPEGVFGYHQWVEVWLGDRWVAMDPTFGQEVADPTHIKFTEGLSDAEGLRKAGVAAAELFGDIELKVLEYRRIDGSKKRF